MRYLLFNFNLTHKSHMTRGCVCVYAWINCSNVLTHEQYHLQSNKIQSLLKRIYHMNDVPKLLDLCPKPTYRSRQTLLHHLITVPLLNFITKIITVTSPVQRLEIPVLSALFWILMIIIHKNRAQLNSEIQCPISFILTYFSSSSWTNINIIVHNTYRGQK